MKTGGAEPVTVCFAGNPNCGKTTLFNAYTGAAKKTANWPGVTVETAERELVFGKRPVRLLDTPGVYSLNAYSMEETITGKRLQETDVDVIVHVADASRLSGSLYLTLQLLEMKKPVVLALNMADLARARGICIDTERLSALLGKVPVIFVSAKERTGLKELMEAAVAAAEQKTGSGGGFFQSPGTGFSSRAEWIAGQCVWERKAVRSFTETADRFLTHPVWGILAFFCLLALVFFLTFSVGSFFQDYLEKGIYAAGRYTKQLLLAARVSPWLVSMVTDGILAGVGGVLSFLPCLVMLFTALAFLEDSGYMARAAWVMDGTMAASGLSGKAFLPLLLGFGCTVPAVMASRVMESEKDRRRVILMTPFMSCSARLPVYVLFSGMFFPDRAALAAGAMYVLGILAALFTAWGSGKIMGKSPYMDALFMELPEYRMPDSATVAVYVRGKVREYLEKAGTTIFLASVILWFLLYLGPEGSAREISESFGASLGRILAPVLRPAGLGSWQAAVALTAGLSAKEVVVASFSVLYGINGPGSQPGMEALKGALAADGFTGASGLAFMAFCLLYTPCAAALGTIKQETGSLKWTLGLAFYQLFLAWGAAVLVFQAGSRIFGL